MALPVLLLAMAGFTSHVLPYTKTPAEGLSPPGWAHHEVLRLGRDFGDRDFEVVIDSWVDSGTPDAIAELRLWWVNAALADERSPFGSKLRRHIEVVIDENASDDWTVTLRGNRKEFVFDVEVDDDGSMAAYADVTTDTGVVPHCRAQSGRFVARRVLGIPIGLRRLEVTCVDEHGTRVEGELAYRQLARGSMYTGP